MAELLKVAFEEASKEKMSRYRDRFRESNQRSGDYFHNKRADNRRTSKQQERNKYNNISQNR